MVHRGVHDREVQLAAFKKTDERERGGVHDGRGDIGMATPQLIEERGQQPPARSADDAEVNVAGHVRRH